MYNLIVQTRQEMWLANVIAAVNGDSLPHNLTPVWRIERFWSNVVTAFQGGTTEPITAGTREEQYLTNLVDAVKGSPLSYALTPGWREEQWYQNIIDAVLGNDPSYALTPAWRHEEFYADIIETIQSQQPTSAVGQWLWNETLAAPDSNITASITGSSFDDLGTAITFSGVIIRTKNNVSVLYDGSTVYKGSDGGWYAPASRSITITGGDDAENETLIAYLTANATRV